MSNYEIYQLFIKRPNNNFWNIIQDFKNYEAVLSAEKYYQKRPWVKETKIEIKIYLISDKFSDLSENQLKALYTDFVKYRNKECDGFGNMTAQNFWENQKSNYKQLLLSIKKGDFYV